MKNDMTNKYFAQLVSLRMKFTDNEKVAVVIGAKQELSRFFPRRYGYMRQA